MEVNEYKAAQEALQSAQELATNGDYDSAVPYYDSAFQQLTKLSRSCRDPSLLGKLRDTNRMVADELKACRSICSTLAAIRGEATPAPPPVQPPASWGSSSSGQRYNQFDEPRNQAPLDDGYRQPAIMSRPGDPYDPDVWPAPAPARDERNPVRIAPARSFAPQRARASQDDNGRLPDRSRNNVRAGAGGQARAVSAQRAGPARGNAQVNAAGNLRAPDRPRQEAAGRNAGRDAGRQAAPAAGPGEPKKKINYVGPDADLAVMLERDMLDSSPGIKFTDIAGLGEAKRVLEEAAMLPLIMPEYFTGIRRPFKGVLLFGPPGTGKTMLAKAVATETGSSFFNVSSATLASKYRGESERMVRCLFDMARSVAPSIIFIDEVDSLCSQRGSQNEHEASRRVKTELLTQVDGCSSAPPEGEQPKHVMVLAATNFPWDIDEAMRRRLEKRIYIPLPGLEERRELLKLNLKGLVIADGVDLEDVAKKLAGYSGDDITNICRDAAMNGMRRGIAGKTPQEIVALKAEGMNLAQEPVTQEDLAMAMRRINPSVGEADIQRHLAWNKEFGST